MSAGIDHVSIFGSKSLPSGWRAVTLEGLVADDGAFVDGDWVESKDQDPAGDVRLIQLADVGDGEYRNRSERFLTSQKAAELGCTFLEPGDLLVARMPDPLGRACIFPGDQKRSVTVVDVAIVRPRNPEVNARWLMYCINAPLFRRFVASLQSGSTRQRISRKNLAKIVFPLPPVDWQGEVVAEIEKQFSRLDEAVVNLKRVKANLKRYKAAILQSAVDGRLLGDGSAASESPANWGWGTCGDVIESIQAGASFKCAERPPMDGEVGVVKVSAVTWGEFDERESKTCLDPERVREALFIRPGDFLFSRANTIELVGACVITKTVTKLLMLSDKILRFRLAPRLDPCWLLICLQSRFGRSEIERLATGNQESMRNIGQDRIRQIRLPLPALTEQRRIVAEVDRRLSIVREVEVGVDANLRRAQVLRQAVLGRAFSPAENQLLETSS